MAAHQPHFIYCGGGGEMVFGIDWPRQHLINLPQPKNVLFDSLFIIIMRGENFVAHRLRITDAIECCIFLRNVAN
jgi:hypothetical protein